MSEVRGDLWKQHQQLCLRKCCRTATLQLLVEEMRRAVSMMSLEGAMMGTAAAEFRCVDHTGSVRSLREFLDAGKIVVLWFYPKAITGG